MPAFFMLILSNTHYHGQCFWYNLQKEFATCTFSQKCYSHLSDKSIYLFFPIHAVSSPISMRVWPPHCGPPFSGLNFRNPPFHGQCFFGIGSNRLQPATSRPVTARRSVTSAEARGPLPVTQVDRRANRSDDFDDAFIARILQFGILGIFYLADFGMSGLPSKCHHFTNSQLSRYFLKPQHNTIVASSTQSGGPGARVPTAHKRRRRPAAAAGSSVQYPMGIHK